MSNTRKIKKHIIYDESSVQNFTNLEAIQKRPSMFMGSSGLEAAHHIVREIMTNVSDEFSVGRASSIHVLMDENENYVAITDNGNGIPVGKLEDIITKTNTGAKFDSEAYSAGFSGGQNGIGLKGANALAEWFKVLVNYMKYENGKPIWKKPKTFETEYREGICTIPVTEIGTAESTGTTVFYKPSKIHLNEDVEEGEVLPPIILDPAVVLAEAKYNAYCNPGLHTTVEIRYKNGRVLKQTLNSNEGMEAYLQNEIIGPNSYKSMGINTLHHRFDDPNAGKVRDMTMVIDISFAYARNLMNHNNISSFANGIYTKHHGTHYDGVIKGFTDFFITKIRKSNIISEKDRKKYGKKLKIDDVLNGLVLALHAKLKRPTYQGQTKHELQTPQMAEYAKAATIEKLEEWFLHNQHKAKPILNHIVTMCRVRLSQANAADKELTKIKKLKGLDKAAMEKFRDCRNKNPEMKELFIVEGKSAAGPVGDAVDVDDLMNQAMYLLKGKLINVLRESLSRVNKNGEVTEIDSILACGRRANFDLSKLQFHKIIFLTDADDDGAHINALLTLYFYYFYPELIERGMIYVANPPLYQLNIGKSKFYIPDDDVMNEILDRCTIAMFDLIDTKGNVGSYEFFQEYLRRIRGYHDKLDIVSKSIHAHPAMVHQVALLGKRVLTMNEITLMNGVKCSVEKSGDITVVQAIIDRNYYRMDIGPDFFTSRIRGVIDHLINIHWIDLTFKHKDTGYVFHNDIYVLTHMMNDLFNISGITRFKGLGEMSKQAVQETCTNPHTRNIKRLTMTDDIRVSNQIQGLMGKDVSSRTQYYSKYCNNI